jgi:hypothetical protein
LATTVNIYECEFLQIKDVATDCAGLHIDFVILLQVTIVSGAVSGEIRQ